MSLLGPSSLGLPFPLADLGCLLLVDEVLNYAVQVCISPSEEQNIVSSDGCPVCMATEALQIYGNILCSIVRMGLPKNYDDSRVLTDLSPNHFCQGADKLRCSIPIAPQGLFVDHFADCKP